MRTDFRCGTNRITSDVRYPVAIGGESVQAVLIVLKRDGIRINRHRDLGHCLRMISAQTLRVWREGKPLHTFPDHALGEIPLSKLLEIFH